MRTALLIMLGVCAVTAMSHVSVATSVSGDEPDVAVVKFGWSRRVGAPR